MSASAADDSAAGERLITASPAGLVARHARLDPDSVEERRSARRRAAEERPHAAEHETERSEGSARAALNQDDHGGAATLGRARQPERRAQGECSRGVANI